MREANEDSKTGTERPEWRAPIMSQFAATEAEGGLPGVNPDGALPLTS